MPQVYVTGPRDVGPHRPKKGRGTVIMTTSNGGPWAGLSPFLLGPCPLYPGANPPGDVARTMENAWQFAKLYDMHAGVDLARQCIVPGPRYLEWARRGWDDKRAHRYPMGKPAPRPQGHWWHRPHHDERPRIYGYVESRKHIYLQRYAQLVIETQSFRDLKHQASDGDVWLWDFDGYNHQAYGKTFWDVIHDETRPMGHAFVLAMLLTASLDEDEVREAPSTGKRLTLHSLVDGDRFL